MVAADDEQAWVCRARDGDPEAYGVLVERYQQRIFRLVAKWLGPDHAGIDDVTQDVFVRAYTALDTFRGDASFSTWLTRIALPSCLALAAVLSLIAWYYPPWVLSHILGGRLSACCIG